MVHKTTDIGKDMLAVSCSALTWRTRHEYIFSQYDRRGLVSEKMELRDQRGIQCKAARYCQKSDHAILVCVHDVFNIFSLTSAL